jgi:hypothetical protein
MFEALCLEEEGNEKSKERENDSRRTNNAY